MLRIFYVTIEAGRAKIGNVKNTAKSSSLDPNGGQKVDVTVLIELERNPVGKTLFDKISAILFENFILLISDLKLTRTPKI